MKLHYFVFACLTVLIFSCKKDTKKNDDNNPSPQNPNSNCPTCNLPDTAWPLTGNAPRLIFKFVLDSTQARLNNLGQPSTVNTSVNAAQSPSFNGISAHYIE
ncbi:MAG: hypothetical protein N3F09_10945, partial [Bacteroidia bacterium]|nr:hypothetical protein [Bacteroidia bacterium]